MYEFLDHTADVAVRLRSATPEDLFRDAAGALLEVQLDLRASRPVTARESIPLRLEAEDGEALLVDFLNELIFLFDSRRFLVSRLEDILVEPGKPARLSVRLTGEALDPERHCARTEVKAATFHGMKIEPAPDGWQADVVFDL